MRTGGCSRNTCAEAWMRLQLICCPRMSWVCKVSLPHQDRATMITSTVSQQDMTLMDPVPEVFRQEDVLERIFRLLVDPADVGRARVVCKAWRVKLDDVAFRRDVFQQKWGLTKLVGAPKKPAFYLEADHQAFVKEHKCLRNEMLITLAVRHNVSEQELKSLNNIIGEYSLRSRSHIYIPARRSEGMIGQFIYDPVACRHLVVLLEDKDAIVPNAPPESADSRILDEKNMNDKIAFMIGRGLKVNHATARYYLHEAQGNIQQAYKMFEDDSDWEAKTGALSFTRY